ncbi:MAG TPA: polysaccharide pyruvyl transferase family protein [Salinivirgaceae bacterium]|nr:polysaccharide pyruvyl transferase family protein [Salinivirgaceae bacterium]
MKIGILTQPLHTNYGGILQNYALQTVLKKMGHEVWTVDRDRKTPSYIIKQLLLLLPYKKAKIRAWMTNKELQIIEQFTGEFIKKNINVTEKVFSTNKLKRVTSKHDFDAYIVGSDQVWRPQYSPCIYNYFLDFALKLNIKRVAYSASFGVDTWEFTESQTQKCKELAQQFDAISVREITGIDLCDKHLDVKAVQTLDPTLLLNKEEYLKLINLDSSSQNKGKIFTYILDQNSKKNDVILWLENNLNLKSFQIMPEIYTVEHFAKTKKIDLKKCVFKPVEEWLNSFVDAEFIITDSFHGVIFSIIFRKQFLVVGNEKRGLSRFTSLLNLLGLEERLITDIPNVSLLSNKIDFDKVYIELNKHKELSLNFLTQALNRVS